MNVSKSPNFHLEIKSTAEEASRPAAELILSELKAKPDLLLCTATGASPTHIYQLLGEEFRRNPALFKHLRILKLDEWGGLSMDDPGSSQVYLRRHVIGPLAISPERFVAFDSEAPDPDAEAARIRSWLAQNGPIDICILGLGTNGHLAMNEPAEELKPFAHVAELASTTLGHSMLAEAKRKPTHGLTLGMVELFQSRKIIFPVIGPTKTKQLGRLMEGNISIQFPASLLWLHPAVFCFCDPAAAAEIPEVARKF